jgi:hypothetical protein
MVEVLRGAAFIGLVVDSPHATPVKSRLLQFCIMPLQAPRGGFHASAL